MIAATYQCGCPQKSMFHSAPIESSHLPTRLPQLYSQPDFLPQFPQNHSPSKIQKSYQPFNQITQEECPDYLSPMRHSALYPSCSLLPAYPKSNFPSNTKYEMSQLCPASTFPPNITNNQVPDCICLPINQMQPEFNEACEDACPGVTEATASKVVSEIMNTGLPYKEIEAIINDNRMVIRMQKDPIKDEFDPPCDCDDQNPTRLKTHAGDEKNTTGNQYGNNVVFQMASANSTSVRNDQNTIVKQSCDQNSIGCRTVTVFPQVDVTPAVSIIPTAREDEKKEKKEKIDKPKVSRSIDLEENPNIFLLRIRKKNDNGERKTNIDLEFRTPRPWRTNVKPAEEVVTAKPQQKDMPKDIEDNDKGKKKEKGKDKGKKKKKK